MTQDSPLSDDNASLSLLEVLDRALRELWPRRTQQELLLDLGERKGWKESTRAVTIQNVAAWLHQELSLPVEVNASWRLGDEPDDLVLMRTIRQLGEQLPSCTQSIGVSRWVSALAPALGSSPKTLANTTSSGLRTDRVDHRWLRVIARIASGSNSSDAWVYHRRTSDIVAAEITARAGRTVFDAGDAVLFLSLLALWQRRRPTRTARGTRGHLMPRRSMPKPVAALQNTLIAPGQVSPLIEVSKKLPGEAGRTLVELAFEASLTEAHLSPHRSRVATAPEHDDRTSGEAWLQEVEEALRKEVVQERLSDQDRAVMSFRVARMRSWRDKRKMPSVDPELVRLPYVRASLALEQRKTQPKSEATLFDSEAPGVFMLRPLLKAHNLLVSS